MNKYGQQMRPYYVDFRIPNDKSGVEGQFEDSKLQGQLDYTYTVSQNNQTTFEREPYRTVSIANPNTYRGRRNN